MKFVSFGKTSPSPVSRPRQPMIQALEPRRLMSLTAAPDFAPDAEAPAPIVHSFGFENQLPPPPIGGFPFAQTLIAPSAEPALSRAGVQSPAIATTTQDSTAVPAPPSATNNSLSGLYASLDHSTVIAIDDADNNDAQQSFTTTAIAITTDVIQNPDLSTANATAEIVTVQKTGVPSASAAALVETFPSPLVKPASGLMGSASNSEVVPQTSFAHTLETEMQSVSSLAREMVSQMGRDLAIELAHIESAADAVVIGQLKSLDGWSIAAVAGATIVAAAYLQSENKKDPETTNSLFSSRMIEPTAG